MSKPSCEIFHKHILSFVYNIVFSVNTENADKVVKMNWMKTCWQDLIVATYEIDVEVIQEYVPVGFELDLFQGKALISVVAFRFNNTYLAGVKMPFYRAFQEINLRIYVKGIHDGGMRRGVVFIKELIPHHIPALIARKLFRENFHVQPVEVTCYGEKNCERIIYQWGGGNMLGGEIKLPLTNWQEATEEKFLGDNYWAFKKAGKKTYAFRVNHKPWKMAKLENVDISIDLEGLYGKRIANAIKKYGIEPRNTFYIDGSTVELGLPKQVLN